MIPDSEKLSNPQVTVSTIKKYNFSFQKKFGQNFLIDSHVIEKIIRAAEITKEDLIIEIGPGIGTMTQYLCESAGHVIAVEIDSNLLSILSETLAAYDNVSVINQDILKCDIRGLIDEAEAKRVFDHNKGSVKVVANLPYYITTPIIMGLLENHVPAASITVMVQKEVAERMNAAPGGKDYGALSLAVQYYADTYLAANVPPNCFIPRPGVGSAVIRLTKHPEPPVKVKDEKMMFRIIRASFEQRRKTLKNGIGNAAIEGITKEKTGEILTAMGLDENIRGERLSLAEFAELTDRLLEA
ncbi:MAG: 16S rRNA (adenine(1518)-N(6)/adenine(1519)-N(6))-dimethyltransferase RsmA [Eubacterium sp.]|nr:16S rRNA (adenine(1518)-N(6)/adenine(1519)-N(6))-dimethyltransferase RsmA [Eubacterium sp.]